MLDILDSVYRATLKKTVPLRPHAKYIAVGVVLVAGIGAAMGDPGNADYLSTCHAISGNLTYDSLINVAHNATEIVVQAKGSLGNNMSLLKDVRVAPENIFSQDALHQFSIGNHTNSSLYQISPETLQRPATLGGAIA